MRVISMARANALGSFRFFIKASVATFAFTIISGITAFESFGEDGPSTAKRSDEPTRYQLNRGDKLRIRFYDRFDRDDLNGDYVIGESGQLRLPRIGTFDVRQKSTEEVERSIRENVEKKGEKLGYFSVDIAECRPFYVSGLVNRPGAYPYVNGLTVVHAISLAGGLYRTALMSPADSMREKSKLAELIDRSKAPLARRARLVAERDGLTTIETPRELLQLDPHHADDIIDRERIIMQRVRDVDAREKAGLEKMVELSKSEADTFESQITAITNRLNEQTVLFANLRKLHDQKLINQQRFSDSITSLDIVQRDKQFAIASLAHAKANLEKAERDLSMLDLAKQSRLAKEIAETELELTRASSMAAETRKLLANLEGSLGQTAFHTYRVTRRDDSGEFHNQRVTETTPLLPDDVIQVEPPSDVEVLSLNSSVQ